MNEAMACGTPDDVAACNPPHAAGQSCHPCHQRMIGATRSQVSKENQQCFVRNRKADDAKYQCSEQTDKTILRYVLQDFIHRVESTVRRIARSVIKALRPV